MPNEQEQDNPKTQTPEPANVTTSSSSTPEPQQLTQAPTSETEPTTHPQSQATTGPQPAKPSKKKWIIGGVVALVIALLVGGGAYAYSVYQAPEKVVADGLMHLLTNTEKTSVTGVAEVKTDEIALKVDADVTNVDSKTGGTAKVTATFKGDMKSIGTLSTSADFVVTEDKAYFKLNDISEVARKFVDVYVDQVAEQYKGYGMELTKSDIDKQKTAMLDAMNPVLNKLNNRWIKTDIKKDSSDDTTCMINALQSMQKSKDQQKEFAKVYEKNQFIVVKESLGSKDGSLGYKLGLDKEKSKSFATAMKDTEFGKAILKCDKTFFDTTEDTANNDVKSSDVEIWVSRWSHKVTRFVANVTGDSDSGEVTLTLDISMKYSDGGTVEEPKDATSMDDLNTEIENLLGGGSSSSVPSSI